MKLFCNIYLSLYQGGRANGSCIKFAGEDLINGDKFNRDVKDGRQFERDILINNKETKFYYPPLDTADTCSIQSDTGQIQKV